MANCNENENFNNRSFFLPDFLLFHYPTSNIKDHYCIMEDKKNLRKNEKKLIYLKIIKILRTTSLGSNFTSFYKTKSVVQDMIDTYTF